MSPAILRMMKNTAGTASLKRKLSHKSPIPISVAIHFLFCLVAGAAMPPMADLNLELGAGVASSPPTVTPFQLGPVRGIDISPSAGEPTSQDFASIRQQGYQFVIVAGWGGVNPNSHAQVQLGRARSAGLLTAGYCYLNFASSLNGSGQVREALNAFGTEAASLGFLAIDVETSAGNQLPPGLHWATPDSAAQQQAIARIGEAIQQVQQAGLRAVIYTKMRDWQQVTGDTQQFKSVPLWNPRTLGGDDLNQPALTNPDQAFGGWACRIGKQYQLDTTLNNPRILVDLDVFDLSAFSGSSPRDRQPSDLRIVMADK